MKPSVTQSLGRYSELVDDFSALLDTARSPLKTCIWRNDQRFSSAEFADWFTDENVPAASNWASNVYHVSNPDTLSFLSAYLAGLIHIQEEIGMLPVMMLDVQGSDRVLDLCAAPGNKMAAMAVKKDLGVTVVANDSSLSRLGIAKLTADRLGLTNVILTSFDAAHYPDRAGTFDKILVDVPCSCEGTFRKNPRVLDWSNDQFRSRLAVMQKNILKRAMLLCRSGGRIVYSTCTFAPEECEAVVTDALRESVAGCDFSIVSVALSGLHHSPGLLEWHGQSFNKDMHHAVRVWPHQNDTGGFFAVALHRSGDAEPASSRADPTVPTTTLEEVLSDEIRHFGMDADRLEQYAVEKSSKKYWSVFDRSIESPPPDLCIARGVKAINSKGNSARLSTAGVLLLGPLARDSNLGIERCHLADYYRRVTGAANGPLDQAEGPVLVFHKNKPLGRGFLRRGAPDWLLESHFPKSWAGMEVAQRISRLQ